MSNGLLYKISKVRFEVDGVEREDYMEGSYLTVNLDD